MSELENTSNDDAELTQLLDEADRRQGKKELVFFVRRFLMTFDPRPEAFPHHLPFDLYVFQEEFILDVYQAIKTGEDLFIEKSRDMGASWCVLAVLFWCWLYEDGFQALIGSRKEEYVDKLGDLKALFPKFDYMIEHLRGEFLLPAGFNVKEHRNYMRLVNPENGNAIIGESSNPNFSRGGRFTVILYDEFGFWQHAKQAWTAGGDATRCRIAVTTPPDVPSYAKTVRYGGKTRVITLHWSKHPEKDKQWYADEQKRRTPEEMLHEIDISWEYSASGRPYPETDNLPFGNYGYDPTLPLYVSLDVGLDMVSIGWYQPVQNSDWWTLVEAFEKTDQIIDWFFPFFGKAIDNSGKFTYTDEELELIERVKYWRQAVFYGDPSGKQRHVESKESAYGKLQTIGIYVMVNEKENEWIARRDATKRFLPRLRVNDTPGTRWWQTCISSAHYPKRAEESQATSAIVKPVHDWTSHHRTQTEYFSVNYKVHSIPTDPPKHQQARPRQFDSSGRLLS